MSIHEEIAAANEERAKERQGIAQEHQAELNRQRLAMESYYDPRLVSFKKRRREQAMQPRKVSPFNLPRKRILATNIVAEDVKQ
jgi:hypothetical protein